jgi:hypothetical protein
MEFTYKGQPKEGCKHSHSQRRLKRTNPAHPDSSITKHLKHKLYKAKTGQASITANKLQRMKECIAREYTARGCGPNEVYAQLGL